MALAPGRSAGCLNGLDSPYWYCRGRSTAPSSQQSVSLTRGRPWGKHLSCPTYCPSKSFLPSVLIQVQSIPLWIHVLGFCFCLIISRQPRQSWTCSGIVLSGFGTTSRLHCQASTSGPCNHVGRSCPSFAPSRYSSIKGGCQGSGMFQRCCQTLCGRSRAVTPRLYSCRYHGVVLSIWFQVISKSLSVRGGRTSGSTQVVLILH